VNCGVRAWARAARSRSSWGWVVIDRLALAVVQRSRSGQSAQILPEVTAGLVLMGRVCPAGQVTVLACSLMSKSSRVYPPSP
jgi:hypothetical protein